jgi:hypothetical protein
LAGEADAKVDKVLLANLNKDEAPELYPALPEDCLVGKAAPPSARGKEVIEKARFLGDFMRYSGYYQSSQSKRLKVTGRYSDRFRRIEGRRDLFDEIVEPSLLVFPPELLSGVARASATLHDSPQFLTSESLAKAHAMPRHRESAEDSARSLVERPDEGDEAKEGKEKGSDDDEEEEEVNLDDDDEEDDDDYAQQHEDDDEDGAEAFGNDDEDMM